MSRPRTAPIKVWCPVCGTEATVDITTVEVACTEPTRGLPSQLVVTASGVRRHTCKAPVPHEPTAEEREAGE